LKQPAGPEWLRARREFFEPLLQMDPERWGNELKPYLQRIELYEITRPTPVLGRRSRVKGQTTDQKSTAASKGEIAEQAARFLQLARAHQQMGDVGRAERILLALRELLRDDPLQERALSLTSEYLNRLRNERQEESDRDQMVLASLGRADRLAAEGQIEAARKIWQSVLELFGEDPLATAHIDRARESLAKYPALSADKKAP
jgi:tetratricopeptide (TPR) repeat protein